jgi:formylglycine-generating enzyme required for sulfatase activity
LTTKLSHAIVVHRLLHTPLIMSAASVCLFALLSSLSGCAAKHPADAAAQPSPPPISPGKGWALVLGIERYEHADPVKYARADAKGTAEMLAGQQFEVTALYDGQATKQAVESAFEEMLLKRPGPDDRVVVFFAGRTDSQHVAGGKKAFLLPSDAESGDARRTGIALEHIRSLMQRSPARHSLLLVAASLDSTEGQPLTGRIDHRPDEVRALSMKRGAHVIAAAAASQPPLDIVQWEHSLFAHYLLEGLGGAEADANRDGVVNVSELFAYLDQNVLVASQIRGRVQRPQYWALTDEAGEMLFVSARSRAQISDVLPDTPGSLAVRETEIHLRGLEQSLRELEAGSGKYPPADDGSLAQRLKEMRAQVEVVRARYQQARLLAGHDVIGQDGARMVLVPAGEFLMGEDSRKYAVGDPMHNYAPIHRVFVDAFYIDKYEVTVSQYAKFLEETHRAEPRFWNEAKLERDGRRPVIGVAWDDANAYCQWTGKRLPTEAEWEKAARGPDGRKYPWGNNEPKRAYANYDWYGIRSWQGYETLAPVGTYEAGKSPYGVYDMAGNVWEWVSDWYASNYYLTGPMENPKGPQKGKDRVVRGGSWRHPSELLRSAYRHHYQPTVLPFTYLGFRCAQDFPK